MNVEGFAVIALFVLGFGLISGRIEQSPITPPMAFVAFGLLMGPQALGFINLEPDAGWLRTLAEFTLILVLFTDASRINFRLLEREFPLPLRMLGLGLPLMILLGFAGARWLLGDQLPIWEAAILATILAPTDAALGQAVINSPRVPICVRQAINVESGLNDGLCLPVLLMLLSIAGSASGTSGTLHWLGFATQQIVLGPIVGGIVGYVGGQLLTESARRRWITHSFEDLAILGLSLLAFALAEVVGGNGFIAAFCAGLTLGNTARPICQCLYDFGEAEGQLLVLLIFMVYGAVMVVPALGALTWAIAFYALLSLFVLRLVGIVISVMGLGLRLDTVIFLGWFGPRGVASLLYGLLVLAEDGIQASDTLFNTMVVTVLISVFAHGLSAYPSTLWYGRRMIDANPESPELKPVAEVPSRASWRQ